MFSDVARALISGAFICPYTMKEGYEYLCDDGNHARMVSYLAKLGMRIAVTTERSSFYATAVPESKEARSEVRRVFLGVKNDLRPMVQFLTMTMNALGTDMVLVPGHPIPKAKYVDAVNNSPGLRADLKALVASMRGTSQDGSNSALLDKVLRKVMEMGYLHLVNREKEIYQVTGKIDYFHEVAQYLVEHEQIPEIEGGDGFEGTLL